MELEIAYFPPARSKYVDNWLSIEMSAKLDRRVYACFRRASAHSASAVMSVPAPCFEKSSFKTACGMRPSTIAHPARAGSERRRVENDFRLFLCVCGEVRKSNCCEEK